MTRSGYMVCRFICRDRVEASILDAANNSQALDRCEHVTMDAEPTEIIAKPRSPSQIRGHRSNVLTHSRCDAKNNTKCKKAFYAIISLEELHHLCEAADSSWIKKQKMMKSYVDKMLPEHRNYKVESLSVNLREKIEVLDNECWRWKGSKGRHGYGRIRLDGKNVPAHRHIFELLACKIPEGAVLCHQCDYPPCVNPAHLIPGTHKKNVDDMILRDRAQWQREWRRIEKWIQNKIPENCSRSIEELPENLRAVIEESDDGCWLWKGTLSEFGSPFVVSGERFRLAHALIFNKLICRTPRGVIFSPECGNTLCVNPAHMKAKSRRSR